MSISIFINDTFNPMASSLKESLGKDYTIVNNSKEAEIIISLAYDREQNIITMDKINDIVKDYKSNKVILLSWFDFTKDWERYTHLLSPEKSSCVIMDAKKFRILQ